MAQVLAVGVVSAADPAELTSSGLSVRPARADAKELTCVGFEKRNAEKGAEYAIKNSCDKKLACEVKWRGSCEDSDGKVTQSRSESARFTVPGSDAHTVQASASECKVGWRI